MASHSSFRSRVSQVLVTSFWVIIALCFVWPGFSILVEQKGRTIASEVVKHPIPASILSDSIGAWEGIHGKMKRFHQLDVENSKLRLENARFKVAEETQTFNHLENKSEAATEKTKVLLSHQTGTHVGRVLESLNYHPPKNLLPSQLYTLGVGYLKSKEDEKVAAIFTLLTGFEEDDTYKTAKNYLITGVAWYRLENYKLADNYFSQVLQQKESPDTVPFQAQARLWKALAAKSSKQHIKEQFWLKELIDHHPHSMEAQWVNPTPEVKRETASHQGE